MIQVTRMALSSFNISHEPFTDHIQQSKATPGEVAVMESSNGDQASFASRNASAILEMWDVRTRSFFSTTMLLIMSIAIVGNILVITVIVQNRGMRTRTNMFLCSLAISDLLCVIFDMPFSLVTVLTGRWLFNYEFLCQLNGFLMPLFFINSTHTLMYIAIHKYVSIRYPFSVVLTERRILLMIAAAWAWAAIVSTLTVTGLSTVHHKLYTTQCGAAIPTEPKAYSHLALVLGTCYVVPLAVIIVCYSSLFLHIQEHGDRLEKTTTTDKTAIYAQQRRILFTLFLVVVVFIVSWTPFGVYSIYLTVIEDETKAVRLANPITYWFGYLNSACNPIIYALRSEAFRDGYREALCRRKWKRFSVSTRLSYNIDNFRLSTHGYPWQLNIPPSITTKSLIKVTKYCNIDEQRFSTCSLPANAFTVIKPGLDTVYSTSEHPEKALNGCDGQDTTPEPTNMTDNNNQSPTENEGCTKTRVRVSKSCDFQAKSVDQNTLEVVRPENSDRASEVEKADLVSGLCFRPRFWTLDWSATERSGHGITPGWRMIGAKETKIPVDNMVHGKGDLNPCTIDSSSIKIRVEPCLQEQETVGNVTEAPMDHALSTGIQQTEENEAWTTPKNWRKRLSTKWKRHSHKTSSHKNPTCPSPASGSTSSNVVRRSVTIKPVPRRCPSVERLDHASQPRKRTMTEVPATYRRRRTGVDCLLFHSAIPQLDQLDNTNTTDVVNGSEKLEGKNWREEKGGEEKGGEEKEREEKGQEDKEIRRKESKQLKETLTALARAAAVPADCQSKSPSRIHRPLSRLDRFLSDPCAPNSAPIRKYSTQRSGTLK